MQVAVASQIASSLLTSLLPPVLGGVDVAAVAAGRAAICITQDTNGVLLTLRELILGSLQQHDGLISAEQVVLREDCHFFFLHSTDVAAEENNLALSTSDQSSKTPVQSSHTYTDVYDAALCSSLGLLVGAEHLVPAVFRMQLPDCSVSWLDGSGALIGPGSCTAAMNAILKHCRHHREAFARSASVLQSQLGSLDGGAYIDWTVGQFEAMAMTRKTAATALFQSGDVSEACMQYQASWTIGGCKSY